MLFSQFLLSIVLYIMSSVTSPYNRRNLENKALSSLHKLLWNLLVSGRLGGGGGSVPLTLSGSVKILAKTTVHCSLDSSML
jgi:hypothetical protein